jgi:hypothetical protein
LSIGIGALSVVVGLGSSQSSLDGIDTLVSEAGDFDIGSDLGSLGGKALADVQLQLILNGLAGEGDVVPDFGVTAQIVRLS